MIDILGDVMRTERARRLIKFCSITSIHVICVLLQTNYKSIVSKVTSPVGEFLHANFGIQSRQRPTKRRSLCRRERPETRVAKFAVKLNIQTQTSWTTRGPKWKFIGAWSRGP